MNRLALLILVVNLSACGDGQVYYSPQDPHASVHRGFPFLVKFTAVQHNTFTKHVGKDGKEDGQKCDAVRGPDTIATIVDTDHPQHIWFEHGWFDDYKFSPTVGAEGTLTAASADYTSGSEKLTEASIKVIGGLIPKFDLSLVIPTAGSQLLAAATCSKLKDESTSCKETLAAQFDAVAKNAAGQVEKQKPKVAITCNGASQPIAFERLQIDDYGNIILDPKKKTPLPWAYNFGNSAVADKPEGSDMRSHP